MTDLGPRDEGRFNSVDEDERKYLEFLIDFTGKIIRQRPRNRESLSCRANALTELGYYESGLECDRALASLCPDNSGIIYDLACSLSLLGRIDEAFDSLERSIKLGYRNIEHMRRDPDLENLRGYPRFIELTALAKNR